MTSDTNQGNQEKSPDVRVRRHDASCAARGRFRLPFVFAAAALAASTCAPHSTPFSAAPGLRRRFRVPIRFFSIRARSSRSPLARSSRSPLARSSRSPLARSSRSPLARSYSARTSFTFESAAGPTRTAAATGPGACPGGSVGFSNKIGCWPSAVDCCCCF